MKASRISAYRTALAHDDTRLMAWLESEGLNPDAILAEGKASGAIWRLACAAIKSGRQEHLERFVPPTVATGPHKNHLLYYALHHSGSQAIRYMLRHGAELSSLGSSVSYPIEQIKRPRQVECLQVLLQGMDLTNPDILKAIQENHVITTEPKMLEVLYLAGLQKEVLAFLPGMFSHQFEMLRRNCKVADWELPLRLGWLGPKDKENLFINACRNGTAKILERISSYDILPVSAGYGEAQSKTIIQWLLAHHVPVEMTAQQWTSHFRNYTNHFSKGLDPFLWEESKTNSFSNDRDNIEHAQSLFLMLESGAVPPIAIPDQVKAGLTARNKTQTLTLPAEQKELTTTLQLV